MKATCPHCGFHAAVEAYLQDGDAKAAVVAAAGLPGELQRLVWSYLGLYRKPDAKQVMTWQRAGRLITELSGLVNDPQIQWDGGRVVPNGAEYWVQAIQRVLDKQDLRRPLDGHNYVRKIAYELAEKAWHQGNVAREKEAQTRQTPPRHCEGLPRGNPEKAWIATGRSAPRNDGEKAGSARATGDDYQPLSSAEALNVVKRMREKLNGGSR